MCCVVQDIRFEFHEGREWTIWSTELGHSAALMNSMRFQNNLIRFDDVIKCLEQVQVKVTFFGFKVFLKGLGRGRRGKKGRFLKVNCESRNFEGQ